ncbi:MAG: glycine--tRNA ligase [Euryarchaeota archaeon]|jgi:glycyl-tRNA synthetase|nr:glycine--tRNA ligase [Euryarchaeota archaeon]MBT5595192.1 glycine--tRNA ligase [Euryarchaeota archaeon]MBT5843805.1 glycine--tRNA ligase [Euryarchaeota archaeon]MBT6641122.1 glycine--tRNA ligase [Euryarchaeota archaeon]MBT6844749.1 glycine--tRNA ligase [Euryarchaeota archaeon]
MTEPDASRLERLSGMLKRRGILLPAFEIYGGAKGLYDFGPVGGRLRNKVNQAWLNHWLSMGNIVEISCPTVTPYSVLEASGHVGEFSDFMTVCASCEEASRADTLLESYHSNPDSLTKSELQNLLKKSQPNCPVCQAVEWSEITAQNLMFNTTIGAGTSGRPGFLRPETAQGMFTSFPALYRHNRERLPFGAIQVGKGYRNEISPRQGMIRLREFNMAELEYFINPHEEPQHDFSPWSEQLISLLADGQGEIKMSFKDAVEKNVIRHATVGYFMAKTFDFLTKIGIDSERLRFRQHEADEMAHYASDCWDAEIHGSFGWVECVGIAHRGCYDLESHEKATGKSLRARREFSEPQIIETDGWTIDGAKAGPVFRALAGAVKLAVENLPADTSFPHNLTLPDGEIVTIESEHVKRDQRTETITGEWYIPHVVEPAFGIDRIIWHILDHAYDETGKDDEEYTVMRLSEHVAPVDYCVFPLFEKDGMGEIAKLIHATLCSKQNIVSMYDSSGSIGRRYARADEIGVPKCITVDHQSLEDQTVTIRDRDSGEQHRVHIESL